MCLKNVSYNTSLPQVRKSIVLTQKRDSWIWDLLILTDSTNQFSVADSYPTKYPFCPDLLEKSHNFTQRGTCLFCLGPERKKRVEQNAKKREKIILLVFYGQFYQHFLSAFAPIFLLQKKFKPQMSVQKSFAINFCTKKLRVKGWWNWRLVSFWWL